MVRTATDAHIDKKGPADWLRLQAHSDDTALPTHMGAENWYLFLCPGHYQIITITACSIYAEDSAGQFTRNLQENYSTPGDTSSQTASAHPKGHLGESETIDILLIHNTSPLLLSMLGGGKRAYEVGISLDTQHARAHTHGWGVALGCQRCRTHPHSVILMEWHL